MNQLIAILKDNVAEKNAPYTHNAKACVEMYSGRYYISYENKGNFEIALCNAVYKGHPMSIAENPEKYTPLRADFDLKSPLPIDYIEGEMGSIKRQYTEDILKEIVKIYQREIQEIIDPETYTNDLLFCIVLEKESPRVEEDKKFGPVVKDGFHLHFPKFICDGPTQDFYIRKKVIEAITNKNVFGGCVFLEGIENIVDAGISKKTWMTYGSMNYKSDKSTPYLYNRIQQINNEERVDKWARIDVDRQWGHVFDSNLDEIDMYDVFEMEMEGRLKGVRYYLPIFMSIRGNSRTLLNEEAKKNMYMVAPKQKKKIVPMKNRREEDIYKDLSIINSAGLMQMLSQDRADDERKWMEVGWTLYNISSGNDEGFQMWKEFSQRSPKFEEGECEERWSNMDIRGLTMATLKGYAKKDNPIAYGEWKQDNITGELLKSLEVRKNFELSVSSVLQKEYADILVCSDSKGIGEWYDFRSHRWYLVNGVSSLHEGLMNNILHKYIDLQKDITNQQSGEGFSETRQAQLKKIMIIEDNLNSITFHKKTIEFCKVKMLDEKFRDKLNSDNCIIGCENGVLDLRMKVFRDGRSDDYCSLSTGVTFPNYDPSDTLDIDDFMEKVFPNYAVRKYFLATLAAALKGGQKRVLFLTGEPDGGKTLTVKIINKAFGKYMGKFSRDLFLVGNRNSSSGSRVDLMHMKHKKIMATQEFSKDQKIDIGIYKEVSSGGDSVAARGNFENDISEIDAEATIIIPVNTLPKLGNDEAVWDRTRVIPCKSKFVKPEQLYKYPVPKTKEEQMKLGRFNVDESLATRDSIAHLGTQLLFRLFEIFKLGEKIVEPKEVMEATLLNREQNDAYLEFKKARIEIIEDEDEAKNNHIRGSDLRDQFKAWYSQTYPSYNRETPKPETIKSEFIKILGIVRLKTDIYGIGEGGKFFGYRWIIQEDDKKPETTQFGK